MKAGSQDSGCSPVPVCQVRRLKSWSSLEIFGFLFSVKKTCRSEQGYILLKNKHFLCSCWYTQLAVVRIFGELCCGNPASWTRMFRSLANEVVTGDLIASLTRLDENRASNVNWNRTRLNVNLIGLELSANMSPWHVSTWNWIRTIWKCSACLSWARGRSRAPWERRNSVRIEEQWAIEENCWATLWLSLLLQLDGSAAVV